MRGRRGQKEIVEFTLLSASSFFILTLVAMMFNSVTTNMRDAENRASVSTLAAELSLAVIQADNFINRTGGTSDFTIYLDFPRDIAGTGYELSYSTSTDKSCKVSPEDAEGSCIRGLAGGKMVYAPLRVSRPVVGTITGSSEQRAAVTYNSDENLIRLTIK
jgi:hypothetical protein